MSDEKQKEEAPKLRPNTIVQKVEAVLEGEPKQGKPVDVNGDITPITRQPITKVDAGDWDAMNVAQLHEQLLVMQKRMMYAQQIGHIDMTTQLTRGINQLHALIHIKTPDELKLI